MTDEQIKQLVHDIERTLGRSEFWLAISCWLLTLFITAWGRHIHFEALTMFSLAAGGAISFLVTGNYLILRQEQLRSPAFAIWSALTEHKGVPLSQSLQTRKFHQSISELYQEDVRAKSLSFVQGARLLVIYDLQQKRQEVIWRRLNELRSLRDKMSNSFVRLEELGESSPQVAREGSEMDREIACLEKLHDQLGASCVRLDAIVLAAHRSLQVQQLHREIADLKSSALLEELDGNRDSLTITNIEQQIAREVEMSLQLEREANTYL